MSEIWYRLELLTDRPEEDSAWIWQQGAAGIEVQDGSTYMEDGGIPDTPDGLTRLIAYFETGQDDAPRPEFVQGREHVLWERYDDRTWETAWQAYFKPVQVSERVSVGPPWEEFDAPAGGIKVEILPGLAFGTGTHETTRLCAAHIDRWLAEHDPASVTMFDVGCGTAILSIVARKLGVSNILGIDLDDEVMQVARENAAANGVDDLRLETTAIQDVPGTFSFVVANILAHILVSIRDALVSHTSIGGTLICSGITTIQRDEFFRDFAGPDLRLVREEQMGEWVLFEWERLA